MTTNANATEQQFLPSINIDGIGSLGNFDKFSGGDVTASITKHRPGGMGPEKSYLGLPVFGNVTIERVYEEERDNSLIALVRTLVGSTYGTVSVQALDADANPYGAPRTYYGRIEGVNDGGADSTSSTPRMWSIDLVVEDVAN